MSGVHWGLLRVCTSDGPFDRPREHWCSHGSARISSWHTDSGRPFGNLSLSLSCSQGPPSRTAHWCLGSGQGRVWLNNSASPAGGEHPPPSDPDFIAGKNEVLQKEMLIWAVFGTQSFGLLGSRTPPPPSPLPLEDNSGAGFGLGLGDPSPVRGLQTTFFVPREGRPCTGSALRTGGKVWSQTPTLTGRQSATWVQPGPHAPHGSTCRTAPLASRHCSF